MRNSRFAATLMSLALAACTSDVIDEPTDPTDPTPGPDEPLDPEPPFVPPANPASFSVHLETPDGNTYRDFDMNLRIHDDGTISYAYEVQYNQCGWFSASMHCDPPTRPGSCVFTTYEKIGCGNPCGAYDSDFVWETWNTFVASTIYPGEVAVKHPVSPLSWRRIKHEPGNCNQEETGSTLDFLAILDQNE